MPAQIPWIEILSSAQLPAFCTRVATEVMREPHFCLWLTGEIGAGKTSWVDVFLHVLGLNPQVKVTSPTFTYATVYKIGDKSYNHCDLYRVSDVAAYERLGIADEECQGTIIEWATTSNCSSLPSHTLTLDFQPDPRVRKYTFRRVC